MMHIRHLFILGNLFIVFFNLLLLFRYIRDSDDGNWEPDVRYLNNAAVSAIAKEDERNSR